MSEVKHNSHNTKSQYAKGKRAKKWQEFWDTVLMLFCIWLGMTLPLWLLVYGSFNEAGVTAFAVIVVIRLFTLGGR